MHVAALAVVVVQRVMSYTAVIPQGDCARLPAHPCLKLRPGCLVLQQLQNGQAVLSGSDRMSADERVFVSLFRAPVDDAVVLSLIRWHFFNRDASSRALSLAAPRQRLETARQENTPDFEG